MAGQGKRPQRRDRANEVRPHVRSGDTVVDFGCGGTATLALLPAAERIGVEPNPPARHAGEERGLRMVELARELDDAIADVVISNHALEHTLAPLDELRELRRVLKPGGRLVLWLPLDDWRTQRRLRADRNHHLYTWTPLLLRNLLEEAGFEVHRCRVVSHAWPPFPSSCSGGCRGRPSTRWQRSGRSSAVSVR